MDGIEKVERDTAFDNKAITSAGIRLFYKPTTPTMEGLRSGVLLEAGFDEVSPNSAKDISSWVYDYAVAKKVDVIDSRAKGVACYDPRYTFVEKLQTISTKFPQAARQGCYGELDPTAGIREQPGAITDMGRSDILQRKLIAETHSEGRKSPL
jgi:hypothetical protein